ncbi:phosphate acyltransferase [Desulfitobacterium sp. Sab5]|uniref:phosphate acyltransferase n=1 Tax=Desulfitobacterium nosdiversum TaxID=3375356 RepID=UPI003CEF92BC
MEIKSFSQLITQIQNGTPLTAAIVSAADPHTIEAALQAYKEKIAIPIFIGEGKKIEQILNSLGENPNSFEIINECNILRTPYIANSLVNNGRASLIVKGFIDTSELLHGILDKETGLRTGRSMSHVAFLEVPGYHKLIGITDGGIVVAPDFKAKKQILLNAVDLFKRLGYESPKVAAVTAADKANKSMPDTIDAFELQELNRKGEISDCSVEGPVSYDIVVSPESAKLKGFPGKHSGDYDVLLLPNIAAGNILSKSLIYNAGAKMGGIVTGAKVPLVLNSRSSSPEEKFYATVLAAACSKLSSTSKLLILFFEQG